MKCLLMGHVARTVRHNHDNETVEQVICDECGKELGLPTVVPTGPRQIFGTYNSKRGGIDWDDPADKPRGYESVRIAKTERR